MRVKLYSALLLVSSDWDQRFRWNLAHKYLMSRACGSPVINDILSFSNTNNNIDCQYLKSSSPKILYISGPGQKPLSKVSHWVSERSQSWPRAVSQGDKLPISLLGL